MSFIKFKKCRIDSLTSLYKFHTVDVLRLDLIHPIVSGNKWFKLKKYLEEAMQLNKNTIATFGGAFSNHILATAAAARQFGLKSIGVIRGEKPQNPSSTLQAAADMGMKLFFISRDEYKKKDMPDELKAGNTAEVYWINEGGYGSRGVEGAKEILELAPFSHYTHIITAAGTGTTLAGLTAGSSESQQVTGISVLKNNVSLQKDVQSLLPAEKHRQFSIIHDYHFGGYAKYSSSLIEFMNGWYKTTQIPSDFVYTGKLFYAVNDLIEKGHFITGSKLLLIHTGGLQGNSSLAKGTLIF